ncbi:MAG: hypothetical protein ABH919_04315 [bacterium]
MIDLEKQKIVAVAVLLVIAVVVISLTIISPRNEEVKNTPLNETSIIDRLVGKELSPAEAYKECQVILKKRNAHQSKQCLSSFALKGLEADLEKRNMKMDEYFENYNQSYEVTKIVSESEPGELTVWGKTYVVSYLRVETCSPSKNCGNSMQVVMAKENGRWKYFR